MSALRAANSNGERQLAEGGDEPASVDAHFPARPGEPAEAIAFTRLRRRSERLQRRYDGLYARFRRDAEEDEERRRLVSLRADALFQSRSAAARQLGRLPDRLPELPGGRAPAGLAYRVTWRQRRTIRRLLLSSGLFSADWYRRAYPDAAGLGDEDALEHFLRAGIREDRDPHPLFSSAFARTQWRENEDRSRPILLAFFENRLRNPHPLFEAEFYRHANADVSASGDNPLIHYIKHGAAERRKPHPAFDPGWYEPRRGAANVPDLLIDYVTHPGACEIDPHPLFRSAYYYAQAPDLRDAGVNPLLHYLVRGWRLSLSPHPLFETAYYLSEHPDVAAIGMEPFSHFLQYGGAEGRRPHPLFSARAYLDSNPDVAAAGVNPLEHYVTRGAAERRPPQSDFPLASFERAYPRLDPARVSPPEAILFGVEGASAPLPSPGETDGVDRYWLPDGLREYVQDRYSDGMVTRLYDLMQVVDRYAARQGEFGGSEDRRALTDRLREAAGEASAEPPDASIIVPVHNALVYTVTSVLSVLEAEHRSSFEILIADDASTDDTAATFAGLGGRVRHIRVERNLGFLENCNHAAREARGRHLVFLNNDTIALPGWLDELIEALDREPAVGMVGSKLLNGDGSLQEAGGILWQDGSAWNYGRGGHPAAPEFNYAKDVDYISGASIATPAALWRELGGFDPLFAPAYCEDSDYALRVRASGRRTVYQPFSELVHHEGRSHGRDTGQSVKAYQLRNGERLFGRWAKVLGEDGLPPGQGLVVARDRSRGKPHILIVDHYVPQWDSDAGSRTMFHFIRLFVGRGFQVSFWSDNLYHDPTYTPPLQRMGVEVIYGPDYAGRFAEWFAERAEWTDYVLLSRPHIASKYMETLQDHPETPLLYYGHDVHWLRAMSRYEVTGDPDDLAEAETVRAQEIGIMESCELSIFPSEAEREAVQEAIGDRTEVVAVPAWIFTPDELEQADRKLAGPGEEEDARRLLFVGGFAHGPNADGLLWFAREVLPQLRAADPGIRLAVVGSNAPESVRALAGEGVEVLGRLSDEALAGEYRKAGVSIAPLRFGGGVKGKVIEAFAKGLPVVSTTVGVQGIPEPDRVAFVADEPASFAAAVLHATRDRPAARAKASRALALVRRDYSPAALAARLATGMPELAGRQAEKGAH